MTSCDYTIIRYSPELRDEVLKLQTHLWGDDLAANDEYLEWKYLQNPFNKEILIYLAMYDNDIVGMLGRYATYWEVGGEDTKITCLMGADAVVHPDHRRKGLLGRLQIFSFKDLASSSYDNYIALSANEFSTASAISVGWQSAGDLQEVYRPVSSSHKLFLSGRRLYSKGFDLLRKHTPSYKYPKSPPDSPPLPNPFHSFDKKAQKECWKQGRFSVLSDNTPRIDDMVELASRTPSDGRLQHVHDRAFFGWRFQNPFSCYRFIYIDEGRLEGYLVLHAPKNRKKTRIAMVDCRATSTECWRELVNTAVDWCRDDNLMTWEATLSKDKRDVLEGQGFRGVDQNEKALGGRFSHSLLLRPVKPERLKTEWKLGQRRLLDLDNWRLQPIISDNF